MEDYEINGSLIKTVTTTKAFDTHGNVTQTSMNYSDGHSETTINTYTDNEQNWFLGRLTRAEVTKQAPGNPAQTRVSSFTYNSVTGLLETETTEPGHPTLSLIKTYSHDGFGNILTSTVSGPGITPRTQTSEYDSRGQFETRSTNALGHKETKAYDTRHGKVTSLTGPNGLTTSWVYDGFGRVQHEYRADGTETRTLNLIAGTGAPIEAVYYVRTDQSGTSPAITYFDSLDRAIRSESTGFDGRKILNDIEYNDRGEIIRTSDPYFSGDSIYWTVNHYDEISRITISTSPGDRISTTAYNGLMTNVTNPLGQTSTRIVNALDQLVDSIDNSGNAVTYLYDSYGNLVEMLDPVGNRTTMQYDIRGNKVQMIDPDSGTTSYVYNTLGQLLSQTDAEGQTVSFTYDLLGRMINRNEPEGTSTWTYDTAFMGIGKTSHLTSSGDHEETYTYDIFGRPNSTTTTIEANPYTTSTDYDQYGRTVTITYPSEFAVDHSYNTYGFFESVSDSTSGHVYWQATSINANGQIEGESLGNGLSTTRVFDAATGFTQSIHTGAIQDLGFQFDAIGNLTQRQDYLTNATEYFLYDSLNRLTSATVANQASLTMTYDSLGNILSKSDVGAYTYGENGAGPHAVTSINGVHSNTYTYDANGNRLTSINGEVTYTSYSKPASIREGATTLYFNYDASLNRYRQVTTDVGTVIKTKLYVGGLYEQETIGTTTKQTHFIQGSGSTIAIHTIETSQPDKTRYLHKDHLGSLQTISDEIGNTVETLSFDAWGKRRNAADWSPAVTPIQSNESDRGYTGHEQLDAVGLVHMNGRVYDPVTGRFLSADPNIQAPENTQNLNRYSYVLNNPLSYTDPSGFFFKKLFKSIKRFVKKHAGIIGAIVGIATGVWISGYFTGLTAAFVGGASGGFTGAVASTIAAGGRISDAFKSGARGGIFGALTGGVFNKVGGLSLSFAQRVIAHGTAGGLLNIAQGGKFGHGFISSAATKLFSPFLADHGNDLQSTLLAGAIGGTVTEISGGKFANGAVTGAFAHLYNEKSSRQSDNNNLEIEAASIIEQKESKNTIGIFYENYTKMIEAKTIDADKYFHCMANCQSASNGKIESYLAEGISIARELIDLPLNIFVRGKAFSSSYKDMKIDNFSNIHGRIAGEAGYTCQAACNVFRPIALNQKY